MKHPDIRTAHLALRSVLRSPTGRVMAPKAIKALRKAVDKATTPPPKTARNK